MPDKGEKTMIIHGKNIGFCLTIGASIELTRICPDKDITKIADLFGDNYLNSMENVVKFISIMSKGFHDNEAMEGRKADYLTEQDILSMKAEDLTELMSDAMDAFKSDNRTEVEVESKNAEKGTE